MGVLKNLKILGVVDDVIKFAEIQFPRKCNCCGEIFKNFKEFLQKTTIPPHIVNSNIQIIDFCDIHDLIAYRNCSCGSTLVLPCSVGLGDKKLILDIINWDAEDSGLSKEEVVNLLRDEVIQKVLSQE